jgi:hypothetical protein
MPAIVCGISKCFSDIPASLLQHLVGLPQSTSIQLIAVSKSPF